MEMVEEAKSTHYLNMAFLISIKKETDRHAFRGKRVEATLNLFDIIFQSFEKYGVKVKINLTFFVGDSLQAYNDEEVGRLSREIDFDRSIHMEVTNIAKAPRYYQALDLAQEQWRRQAAPWISHASELLSLMRARHMDNHHCQIDEIDIVSWSDLLSNSKRLFNYEEKFLFLMAEFHKDGKFHDAVVEKGEDYLKRRKPQDITALLDKKSSGKSSKKPKVPKLFGSSSESSSCISPLWHVRCLIEGLNPDWPEPCEGRSATFLMQKFPCVPDYYLPRQVVIAFISKNLASAPNLSEQRSMFIYGMAGVGKSVAVTHYVKHYSSAYFSCIYLSGENDIAGIKYAAQVLGIDHINRKDIILELAKRINFLARKENKRCLLVIDNVRDLSALSTFTQYLYCDIIFISPRNLPVEGIPTLEVNPFSEEEAQKVCKNILLQHQHSVAPDVFFPLLKDFGNLPVAIVIAMTQICINQLDNIAQYRAQLAREPELSLEEFIDPTSRKTLPKVFLASLNESFGHLIEVICAEASTVADKRSIEKQIKSYAFELLFLCSYLDASHIPVLIIKKIMIGRKPEQSVLSEDEFFLTVIRELSRRCLLEYNTMGYISCHSSLQLVMRAKARTSADQDPIQFLLLLADSFEEHIDIDEIHNATEFALHIDQVVHHYDSSKDLSSQVVRSNEISMGRLMAYNGIIYAARDDYFASIWWLTLATDIFKRFFHLISFTKLITGTTTHLAYALWHVGELHESKSVLLDTLSIINTSACDEDILSLKIVIYGALCQIYYSLGEILNAVKYAEKVVFFCSINEDMQTSREYAVSLSILASIVVIKEPQKALSYLENARIILRDNPKFGENHYDMGKILARLGLAKLLIGQNEDAMDIFFQALNIFSQYKKNQMMFLYESAVVKTNIGVAYLTKFHNVVEGQQHIEEAYKSLSEHPSYGPEHPEVAKIALYMGYALMVSQDFSRALILLNDANTVLRKNAHFIKIYFSEILKAQAMSAAILVKLGGGQPAPQALSVLSDFADFVEKYGITDPSCIDRDSLVVVSILSQALMALDRAEDAIKLAIFSCRILCVHEAYGVKHPIFLNSLYTLMGTCFLLEKFEDAFECGKVLFPLMADYFKNRQRSASITSSSITPEERSLVALFERKGQSRVIACSILFGYCQIRQSGNRSAAELAQALSVVKMFFSDYRASGSFMQADLIQLQSLRQNATLFKDLQQIGGNFAIRIIAPGSEKITLELVKDFLCSRFTAAQCYPVDAAVPKIDGLELVDVDGDGSCLYYAIECYTHTPATALRSIVADYMRDNPIEVAGFLEIGPTQTFEHFLNEVREEAWGDHVTIEILQRYFNRPIIVIGPEGPSNIDDGVRFEGSPIFVYYNGVNHYKALPLSFGYEARDVYSALLRQRNRENIHMARDISPWASTQTFYASESELELIANRHRSDEDQRKYDKRYGLIKGLF